MIQIVHQYPYISGKSNFILNLFYEKVPLLLTFLLSFYSNGQITTSPDPVEVDQQVTITVDINSSDTDCNGMSSPNKVYMHSGVGDDSNPWGFSVVGNWGLDDGVGEMTDNGDGSWSITFVPETYYGLSSAEASSVTKWELFLGLRMVHKN